MLTEPQNGPRGERPPAENVQVGTGYRCTDTGELFRSNGREWITADAEDQPWTVKFTEDLRAGDVLRESVDLVAPSPAGVVFGSPPHTHRWVQIVEIRDYDETNRPAAAGEGVRRCAIALQPNGELIGIHLQVGCVTAVKADL